MTDVIVISPFRYQRAYRLCENEKGSTSRPEIHSLIKKDILTAGHLDLIRLLFEYKYLTSYQLESLYNMPIIKDKTGTIEITIKEALSLMVKKGIILRHYFSWQERADAVYTERRSVNFYTLSKGTCLYLEKELKYNIDSETYMVFDKDFEIYEKLSINGFVSKYKNNNRSQHVSIEVLKQGNSPMYKKNFFIDAYIKCISDVGTRYFAVYAVRRNETWQQDIELKLSLLKDHLLYQLSINAINEVTSVLLICEDDMHVITLYLFLNKLNFNFSYIFTTDVRQHNDATYENLLLVFGDENAPIYREYKSPLLV